MHPWIITYELRAPFFESGSDYSSLSLRLLLSGIGNKYKDVLATRRRLQKTLTHAEFFQAIAWLVGDPSYNANAQASALTALLTSKFRPNNP